jgi:hypothetical protein
MATTAAKQVCLTGAWTVGGSGGTDARHPQDATGSRSCGEAVECQQLLHGQREVTGPATGKEHISPNYDD